MDDYLGRDDILNDILAHYGTKRHSGRYPWGSGDNPYQHSGDWLSRVTQLRKDGMSETDISEQMGMSVKELRAFESVAKAQRRGDLVATAKSLKADGLGASDIGRKMGLPESTVRSLLDEEREVKRMSALNTAEFLKNEIETKGVIDVGKGVEKELNISRNRLDQAIIILEAEGYQLHPLGVPQVTNPGKQTNFQLLCPKDMTYSQAYEAAKNDQVHSVKEYASNDDGQTFKTFRYPESLDSSRVGICYADEGGREKDGVIELRRNVDDISMGDSSYAQVRILVDGTHYLKGMAIYSDDLPDGVDVLFNTNKTSDVDKMDVLKPIKTNSDGTPAENPFGSYISPKGQLEYTDKNGETHLGLVNKVHSEGDWGDYSLKLPSQFLSKQSTTLVKKQLNLTYADKEAEFNDICSLTNPTLKRAMLNEFADTCDGAAIHLKAAALPGQSTKVILPVPELKPNEVYAPTYNNGEHVVLIRYPHGGTFEIPELVVNNKQPKARDILGNAPDAIGINSKVADQLSGADFDGDTVTVIPVNDRVKITHKSPLKDLEGFDPKLEYGHTRKEVDSNGKVHLYSGDREFKQMKATQNEMGKISNLITDMTLIGAPDKEIARAVKHSMVVIDAEKHGLDYQRSYKENGIAELKEKYQGRVVDGKHTTSAATIISRAKGQTSVLKRSGSPNIDPETGKTTYDALKYYNSKGELKEKPSKYTGEVSYKTGKLKTQKSTQMAETDDAFTLVSPYRNPREIAYADYANKMKSLANRARKESIATGTMKYDKHAKDIYKAEYDSLMAKLNTAEKMKPRERKAQIFANGKVNAIKNSNPELKIDTPETRKMLKKIKQQAIEEARYKYGVSRKDRTIVFTDREWEAIQSGAISDSKAHDIFKYVDKAELKRRAMPKTVSTLSTAQMNKAKAMANSGYTLGEIAESMGKSASTISKYING